MNRLIIITLLILLLVYMLYLNNQYKDFYNIVPKEVKIEAIVISNSKKGNYYNSYTIKGINSIFKNKRFILYTKEDVKFGDKIKASGTFMEPEEQRNYKGFNYKKYLQTQGIYGSIKIEHISVISENNVNIIFTLSNTLRSKIIKNIKTILPAETSGLCIGILLGDKTNIDEEVIQNFQRSGLSHTLAVSGIHVSYIIIGITFIININKLHKKSGYLLTILTLIVFMFLTDFSISVIRACIMAIILIFSKLLHRKANINNTLIITLLITLFYNPFSIRSVSLQLSYLGTIGVIYLFPIIDEQIQKLKINNRFSKILSIPIAAQISILPIMIINFNTISFTILISNLLVMPLIGIIVILGFIDVLVSFIWTWAALKLGTVINIVLKIINQIAKLCGNLAMSNIYITKPCTITVIVYYLVLIIIIYMFNLKKSDYLKQYEMNLLNILSKISIKKSIIIILVVICVIEFPYLNYNGKLKIFFIDVKQR